MRMRWATFGCAAVCREDSGNHFGSKSADGPADFQMEQVFAVLAVGALNAAK